MVFGFTRQFPRVALKLPIAVEVFGERLQAESVEVGGGGMSLAHVERLGISQPIQVEFELPQGARLSVHAVVWWKKNKLVGIRFDPSDPHCRPLKQWIEQHSDGGN
jgi:hypothetical protein